MTKSEPIPRTSASAPPDEPEVATSEPTLGPLQRASRDTKGRHLVRAAIVGAIAGLVAVGFRWALAESERSRVSFLGRLHNLPSARIWAWMVLPALGLAVGSLVGWFTTRFSPDSGGSGIPHIKGVLLHVRSMRWKSLLPIKFLGGVLGIGAGLSLGREGPTVQMGAAIGQLVADCLRVPSRAVPQLLSCGAGAGLAAAFSPYRNPTDNAAFDHVFIGLNDKIVNAFEEEIERVGVSRGSYKYHK